MSNPYFLAPNEKLDQLAILVDKVYDIMDETPQIYALEDTVAAVASNAFSSLQEQINNLQVEKLTRERSQSYSRSICLML